ncbi:MAG: hypothetical protein KAT53_02670 [Dehalococcoidia bacterium]|nr:hypothetical protein [Dehalococcoidia bacterium]
MSELGPVSQAILDHVNSVFGSIVFFRMIYEVSQKMDVSHTNDWYFRRLVALALEGRIEGKIYRTGDKVAIKFRRLQDKGLEGLPEIEVDWA